MSYRIDIDPNDPKSIDRALKTEWLLTNGLGGYAMGTALGVNTRRYHGLLVAATKPPVGRVLALHSMIEQLVIPKDDGTEEIIDLSTQQFVGPDGQPMLHPNGWKHLRFMRLGELPINSMEWFYQYENFSITRNLVFDERNCAQLSYEIESVSNCMLRLRPFVPMRDFHSIGCGAELTISPRHRWITIAHGQTVLGIHKLHLNDKNALEWKTDPQRWQKFCYSHDRNRGQDWQEDLWSPGVLIWNHPAQSEIAVAFEIDELDGGKDFEADLIRPDAHETPLEWAASQFVVERPAGNARNVSVIAGYPWFGDWGRDTMIALPGLMLCTGSIEEARSTLLTFARALRNGLIPNLFDDYGGGAHYNSIDASLWFVHAVHALFSASLLERVTATRIRQSANRRKEA